MSASTKKNGTPSLKGRKKNGQFKKGEYAGGPGNPNSGRVQHFRHLILKATTDADLKAIWAELTKAAKGGKPWAIKELLDRVIGKAHQSVEISGDMQHTLATVQSGLSRLSERLGHRKVDLS